MATNTLNNVTASTATTLTSNGTTGPYSLDFEYATVFDVEVFVDGVLKTRTTDYTFTSATQITFTSAPSNGATILIQRNTQVNGLTHFFSDGSVLSATELNNVNKQLLHSIQELVDDYVKRDGSQTINTSLVFEGSTNDANETTLSITDPTADRTITLPDITGTVITSGDTGTVSSTMITDGTIVNADINASAAIAQSKLNIANATTSTAGYQSAADKTKLDGIESNATADQTAAEIRTLVESATDSNVFTDADHTKLNSIEANATADQTDAEIRAAVEAASDSNVFTDADHTKLNSIEASADVTDATNVDAAGAVMNSDLDTKGEILVGDGAGDPTALSVGQNNYVLIADSNEASGVKWGPAPTSGGLNNIVEDTSPQLGGALDVQAQEINTSTTNGNIKLNPNGTGVVEIKGDGSSEDGTLQLNCSQNSHGVKIKSPAHSAGASYTLTLPINIVNGQFLKTDANGNLSWAAVDLTSLSATNLTSGTIPDARFPATLPAISGANLTNLPAADLSSLNASNLSSGTIPDARFPATLPAASAANLTAIPAANITGTLPAINGAALTDLDGSNIATGTVAAARVATLNQDTTGSAATLTTARAINGVNFDGSADITVADSTKMPLAGGTFTGEVIFQKEITETVFAITDASSVALDPINGMIQTWTLGANRTATDSLTTGQSMLLIVTASSSNYTLTWPTMTWVGGSAPTLGGAKPTAIELFKVGSTLYGATVGDLG